MIAVAAHLLPAAVHASAVVVGEHAVLLRGASGAGKSGLALALIEAAVSRGSFARLVADDRVIVRAVGNRLIVAPHPRIAGRVERRFVGIAAAAHEDEAVAALVVDLVAPPDRSDLPRLPTEGARWTVVGGVRLPRLALPAGYAGSVEAVLHALRTVAE